MVTKTYGLSTRMTADGSRCEALFASALQRSDAPTADVVAELLRHPAGAATGAERMRWVRQLITQSPAPR